jgi:hypothetical protein
VQHKHTPWANVKILNITPADAHINRSAVACSLHYQQKLSLQVQCKLFILVLYGYKLNCPKYGYTVL